MYFNYIKNIYIYVYCSIYIYCSLFIYICRDVVERGRIRHKRYNELGKSNYTRGALVAVKKPEVASPQPYHSKT